MINILDLFGIGAAIKQGWRTLIGYICAEIYKLIESTYNIFTLIARAEILDNEFVQAIYRKVGLILGLFMLFKLTFSLIQALIDPTKLSDKKTGFAAIIQRMIIAIVLLGITPAIFREAFNIQNMIIGSDSGKDNVIYKLIVGNTVGGDVDNFGRLIASDLFFSFYSDDESPFYSDGRDEYQEGIPELYQQNNYNTIKDRIQDGESYDIAVDALAITKNDQYVIEFHKTMSILVGLVVLWMMLLYCIQTAIRVFQLAYLQLIAPIPILSYISDPEGTFSKWIKQCTTTFLDLFIRLAIIYFIIYLSTYVLEQLKDADSILRASLGKVDEGTLKLIKVFLIVGLLLFAKRVPELLKDLFPNMGGGAASLSMGLKAPKEVSGLVKGAAGALTAGAVGLIGGHGVGGRIKGLVGGVTKGAYSGAKGKKLGEIASARSAQNLRNRQNIESGSTWGGRMNARLRNTLGLEARTAEIDRQIEAIDHNDIRPLDDRLHEIDNDASIVTQKRNNSIIGANKAMLDEAEKQLLKSGAKSNAIEQAASDRIRDLKGKIDWSRENLATGEATLADVSYFEDLYNEALKEESSKWIDRHITDNEEVAKNMRVISNATGTTTTTALEAKSASDSAKMSNASLASTIADLEHERETIGEQKRILEDRKTALNRSKEIPTINENAIKK